MLNLGADGGKKTKRRDSGRDELFHTLDLTKPWQEPRDEERIKRILCISIINKAFWPPVRNTEPSHLHTMQLQIFT